MPTCISSWKAREQVEHDDGQPAEYERLLPQDGGEEGQTHEAGVAVHLAEAHGAPDVQGLLPVAQLPHGDVDAVEHGHHRPAHQQGADQLGRPLHLKGLDDGGGDDDIEDQEGQLADGLFGQLPDPRQQEADPHQEEKGQDLARHQEETFQHTIPPFRAGRAPHLG